MVCYVQKYSIIIRTNFDKEYKYQYHIQNSLIQNEISSKQWSTIQVQSVSQKVLIDK